MAQMTTKEFINVTYILQLGEIVKTYPYISFMVMGICIEFIGKCMNAGDFREEGVSRKRFEEAINNLEAFKKYRELIGKDSPFDLYSCLRCGLAHAAAPKHPITFSSKDEMPNLEYHEDGKRVNLRCEDFWADVVAACDELFNMPDP